MAQIDLQRMVQLAAGATSIAASVASRKRPTMTTYKGDRDPVTDIDREIDEALREFFRLATPDIDYYGEETGQRATAATPSEYVWVVDPIDGTANYRHGLPLWGVSVSLVRRQLEPASGEHTLVEAVAASIRLPGVGEHYWATKDGPAYMQRAGEAPKILEVPSAEFIDPREVIVACGDYVPGDRTRFEFQKRLAATLANGMERVRFIGSAAHDLAWMAAGRFGAMVMISTVPFDTFGGVLIARRAGVQVRGMDGEEWNGSSRAVIATVPGLDISPLIAAAQPTLRADSTPIPGM